MLSSFTENRPIQLKGKQRDAWHYLTDNNTTEIFYGGGAGGGKSFLGCLWHIDRRVRYPGTRGLIGRAKISALEQSTLVTYFQVADMLGYQMGVDYNYNSQKHVIAWSNGSETILKDLFFYPSDPDFISLGSTEFTDAFIDEGAELVMRAFELVSTRIRYKLTEYKLIPKVLVTCNPSPGWIKDNYISNPQTNHPIRLQQYQKFVTALVTDNPDKDFVSIYRQQLERTHSQYDKNRLLYGDWDAVRDAQNPFAHQWEDQNHIAPVEFQRDKQLYISIDFNLSPFAVTFWHYWQDSNGHHVHGIDEAEIEQGSIPAMVELIKHRYGHALHASIMTGDAMGNQRQIALKDNASHYMELSRGLRLSQHQVIVPANPTHSNSRTDVNQVLWQAKQLGSRIEFKLNATTMPNTVRDMRNVQCDAFGQIIKRNRHDLNQRGDFLDCSRYLCNVLILTKKIITR
jgi:hypothetical protein